MTKIGRGSMRALAVLLLFTPPTFAQIVTDAEFKCAQKVDKASAKFVGAKNKCVSKCLSTFWKGEGPSGDCFAPYSGVTAQCVNDTVLFTKGAENKFNAAILKACDPLTKAGTDCPECYNGGDCVAFADDWVASVENQVDSFVPGVACELGADELEQKCQLNTGKTLAKLVGGITKCYDKCQSSARKGLISAASCAPPASDPTAVSCIDKANAKSILNVNKKCGDVGANPDCGGTDNYPDGAAWTNLVNIAVSGNQPTIYCELTTTTSTSTTTTSAAPTTSSSSSSTVAPTTSSSSSSTAAPTTSSSSSSTAAPTTSSSSSSTAAPTTTTSSTSSSTSTAAPTTTTSSTSSSTSTTIGGGPSGFDFRSTAGTGTCGNTFRDVGGTVALKNLLCGSLSLGGGLSQVPDNATPSGATNRFTLTGCVGPACNIGTTASGSTPVGVDCTAPGCQFGTPLPISNAGLSVCVTNTFFPNAQCLGSGNPFACCTGAGTGTCAGPTGTLNTSTGAANWVFQLNSATVLTGNPTFPCPTCRVAVDGAVCNGSPASPCTGVCDGSPNQGAACTSRNPNGLTSSCPSPNATAGTQRCYRGSNNNAVCSTGADCPAPGLCAQFIGNIPINLSPLTTGTASLTAPNDNAACTGMGTPVACCTGAGTGNCNIFCAGQTATQKGAFRSGICLTGANSGKPCTLEGAVDAANCGAGVTCRSGTLTNICQGGSSNGLGCTTSAGCPSGVCVRAGTLVHQIRETGLPAGALSIGVPATIRLGSTFCVQATTNPTVNANANLPGPGATSVVGTVTLLP